MVVFCIINGCKNNDNNKENDSRNVLFHVFSSNPVLKARWLKAIGRSDWEPPDYAGICNDHFNAFRLNSSFEGSLVEVCRICLAADDDMTLYSLQYGKLKQYMDTILPINNDSCLPQFVCFECAVHLRKCYNMIKKSETSQAILFDIFLQNGEITKSLVKKLNREKFELKSALQPHNVTPTYIFDYQFNNENNLSDLINIEYIYDLKKIKTELDIKSNTDSVQTYDSDDNDENLEQDSHCVMQSVSDQGSCIDDETDVENDTNITIFYTDDEKNNVRLWEESTDGFFLNADESNVNEKEDANCVIKSVNGHVSCDENETNIENYKNISIINIDNEDDRNSNGSEESSDDENKKNNLRNGEKLVQKDHVKSKNNTRKFIKSREFISKYFNIVNLITLQEKIDEWNKAMENPSWMKTNRETNEIYKCEVCSKLFVNRKPYELHRVFHDPSNGTFECPVCKLRQKNARRLKNHMLRHCKKFNCKVCHKSFLSLSSARQHCLYHMGQVYKCTRCSYTSRHLSLLSAHVQKAHSHAFACELCGRACVNRMGLQRHHELQHPGEQLVPDSGGMIPCEECNLKFKSENALRVHLLTSVQHRDPSKLALSNTCKHCGEDFTSRKYLSDHLRSTHVSSIPKTSIGYPKVCEYCDEIMETARDHYWHFRREHSDKRNSFNVIFAVICEICGKRYKNEQLLKRHKLRHDSPKVQCPMCNKLFYDKDRVELHIANVHNTEKAHVCFICGVGIKSKANLNRHMKIHTDVTPFECSHCGKQLRHKASLKLHIRTVHQRIYYPSELNRKKRTRKSTENTKRSTPRHAGSKRTSATEPA